MITEAVKRNLLRIDSEIDRSLVICPCCNNPMPSWIEISPVDFCTRKCSFCPKGTDSIAPNQRHLYLHNDLSNKIANDLSKIGFTGIVVLAGYGEPTASPNIMETIKILSSICRVEIVTNGDLITEKSISEMINSGISFISVSVYDSSKQSEDLKGLFEKMAISNSMHTLRDRWYGSDNDFGVKLTNRAGLVNIGNQPEINPESQCFYPHYSMMIDWNGDVLLCPQDWHRRIKFGNIAHESIHDIWVSSSYKKYRNSLFKGNRTLFPCSECNCTGTLHGKNHAEKWNDSRNK